MALSKLTDIFSCLIVCQQLILISKKQKYRWFKETKNTLRGAKEKMKVKEMITDLIKIYLKVL